MYTPKQNRIPISSKGSTSDCRKACVIDEDQLKQKIVLSREGKTDKKDLEQREQREQIAEVHSRTLEQQQKKCYCQVEYWLEV